MPGWFSIIYKRFVICRWYNWRKPSTEKRYEHCYMWWLVLIVLCAYKRRFKRSDQTVNKKKKEYILGYRNWYCLNYLAVHRSPWKLNGLSERCRETKLNIRLALERIYFVAVHLNRAILLPLPIPCVRIILIRIECWTEDEPDGECLGIGSR